METIHESPVTNDTTTTGSLLLRAENNSDIGKYILLLWFKDAIGREDPVPKLSKTQNDTIHRYIKTVCNQFPNRGSPTKDDAIGSALIALKTQLGKCSVERLNAAALRVDVVIRISMSDIVKMLVKNVRSARSGFNDTSIIDRTVEDLCREMYEVERRRKHWLRRRDKRYDALKSICKKSMSVRTKDMDLVLLLERRFFLSESLNTAPVHDLMYKILKQPGLLFSQNDSNSLITVCPEPETRRFWVYKVAVIIWSYLDLGRSFPYPFYAFDKPKR